MKEIWLPTSQWPRKLADGKETRSSRWDWVGVWRGGQNNKGRSTTPREVIGFQEYKDQYCSGKVQGWRENIELLAEIAKNQPHNAYIAFTKGCKLKFAYFMRRIDSWRHVEPADEAINDIFVPVLFGQTARLPEELQELFTRPPAQEGLGIPDMKAEFSQHIRCLKVNNSTACSSYMYEEHLHASGWANCGRPETTTAVTQDDSSSRNPWGAGPDIE